jgi:hypothetical protein
MISSTFGRPAFPSTVALFAARRKTGKPAGKVGEID